MPAGNRNLKVISWNLLRLTGAGVEDVAALVEQHHPDLLFLQEAIEETADLPALVGGYFFREPLEGRIYGLAVGARIHCCGPMRYACRFRRCPVACRLASHKSCTWVTWLSPTCIFRTASS